MTDSTQSLDALRHSLGLAIADHAAFDGWTVAALDRAADDVGVSRDEARLVLGVRAESLIDAYFAAVARRLDQRLADADLPGMKVRQRVRTGVATLLALLAPHKEAVRRASALLPLHGPRAARRLWALADGIWHAAGDTAVDYNHYTKRLILSGVIGTTLLAWLGDQSEGTTETLEFLDRRIEGVMRFETLKARGTAALARLPDPAGILGRLRYR